MKSKSELKLEILKFHAGDMQKLPAHDRRTLEEIEAFVFGQETIISIDIAKSMEAYKAVFGDGKENEVRPGVFESNCKITKGSESEVYTQPRCFYVKYNCADIRIKPNSMDRRIYWEMARILGQIGVPGDLAHIMDSRFSIGVDDEYIMRSLINWREDHEVDEIEKQADGEVVKGNPIEIIEKLISYCKLMITYNADNIQRENSVHEASAKICAYKSVLQMISTLEGFQKE